MNQSRHKPNKTHTNRIIQIVLCKTAFRKLQHTLTRKMHPKKAFQTFFHAYFM